MRRSPRWPICRGRPLLSRIEKMMMWNSVNRMRMAMMEVLWRRRRSMETSHVSMWKKARWPWATPTFPMWFWNKNMWRVLWMYSMIKYSKQEIKSWSKAIASQTTTETARKINGSKQRKTTLAQKAPQKHPMSRKWRLRTAYKAPRYRRKTWVCPAWSPKSPSSSNKRNAQTASTNSPSKARSTTQPARLANTTTIK